MATTITKPKGAMLVGSVPLETSEDVFRAAAETLGRHLKRVPDGETGNRTMWIGWQHKFLEDNSSFEMEPPQPGQYAPLPRMRLKDGLSAKDVKFSGGIGYASVAKESYAEFKKLKDAGTIPAHVRFQVSLPTPMAPIAQFISRDDQAAVEPVYEQQMFVELAEILKSIPADQLAIQWDVAFEMGMWDELEADLFDAWFEPVKLGIVDRLTRCADAVPTGVEMGFHFCYGDFGHEHFAQPVDAGSVVEIANELTSRVSRSITWIHLPVPRDRSDAAYFAPLSKLRIGPDTELYLGIVHITDGLDGAATRIAAAQTAVQEFGVATECGFGRRPADTVRPLMSLHADIADPI